MSDETDEDEDTDHYSDCAETPAGDGSEEFGSNIALRQAIAPIEEDESSPADQDGHDQFLLEW
ncbi:hypothetical protein J0X25_18805 [Haloterrigena alkaliphila]|nr:hypothetical protein [Haloterrigena alkaliphila]UHQ95046.1 hypothetical protein J0X25_18805 [Haloterrigena alkaliphila]